MRYFIHFSYIFFRLDRFSTHKLKIDLCLFVQYVNCQNRFVINLQIIGVCLKSIERLDGAKLTNVTKFLFFFFLNRTTFLIIVCKENLIS